MDNMEKIIKELNWYYYGVMVLTLLILTLFYYAYTHAMYAPMDRFSTLGIVLQYVVIFLALITIPAGLYGFKYLCDKQIVSTLKTPEDLTPEKLELYKKLAIARILVVSCSMPFGIAFYYLFGCYQSMLWVAAIAAIGWYFTKPTLGKMQNELTPKDPNQENY